MADALRAGAEALQDREANLKHPDAVHRKGKLATPIGSNVVPLKAA